MLTSDQKYTTDEECFREFEDGYTYEVKVYDRFGIDTSERKEKWFSMDQPIRCSYKTGCKDNDYFSGKKTYLHNNRTVLENMKISNCGCFKTKQIDKPRFTSIDKVELRGITLRQLRAIWVNVKRRCVKEEWKDHNGKRLTPDRVNLYDAKKYIIKPFTSLSRKSFVETLPSTDGPQPPRWFVSHWWGEPIKEFLACIETHNHNFWANGCAFNRKDTDKLHEARGGGMTIDTPYWICSYANNQWDLSESITKDPSKSGFTRALAIAGGRTVSILDSEGIVFSRIWCGYELYLTLLAEKMDNGATGVWAVYTAHKHTFQRYENPGYVDEPREAVGIVSGRDGATSDGYHAAQREIWFPFKLILRSLNTTIETADASVEDDRRHILNTIAGKPEEQLDDTPLKEHTQYDHLNSMIRGSFASSYGTLRSAHARGGDDWANVLKAMSKGVETEAMYFDLTPGRGWDIMTVDEFGDLVSHLPLTIKGLFISCATMGPAYIYALAQWIEKSTNLQHLSLQTISVGDNDCGRDAGAVLATAISTNSTIQSLSLNNTDLIGSRNVSEWSNMLATNGTLKNFRCHGLLRELSTFEESNEVSVNITNINGDIDYEGTNRIMFRFYMADGILPDGMLTDAALKILAKGIASNKSLETISIVDHCFGKKNSIAELYPMLMENQSINKVIISHYCLEKQDNREQERAVKKLRKNASGRAFMFVLNTVVI